MSATSDAIIVFVSEHPRCDPLRIADAVAPEMPPSRTSARKRVQSMLMQLREHDWIRQGPDYCYSIPDGPAAARRLRHAHRRRSYARAEQYDANDPNVIAAAVVRLATRDDAT